MSVADWIINRVAARKPDFIIGAESDPYLIRWWVIPRNKWFNIYLHNMVRDDEDRALHDHPWLNASVILRGGFWEVVPSKARAGYEQLKWRKPGQVVFRRAKSAHRLMLQTGPSRVPSWSLFITGPVVRKWGFHCPQGWIPWEKFVAAGKPGEVGLGCDQPIETRSRRQPGKAWRGQP